MSDGELILVAAALLAAGIAASLLASRVRLPGLLLFLGLGMALGHRRPRLDRLRRLRAGAHHRRGRARADPVRGRAHRRLRGDQAGARGRRCRLRSWARSAHASSAASPPPGCSTSHDRGDGARRDHLGTDGAAIFALLRESTLRRPIARTLEGESGFNDPVAVLLVIGFIDWIEQPDYGVAGHAAAVRARDGHRRGCGPGRGLARGVGAPAHAAGQRRPVSGRDAVRRRRSPSAAPRRCTGPASSRPTWPAWCSGRARSRRSRR